MTGFSPETRRYPALSDALRGQLDRIEPATDGVVLYFPCKVRLLNESWQDFVFVVESTEYIRMWGVWPDQDAGKREIRLENVVEIQESPSCLPRPLAQILYDAGESGMGYLLFGVRYNDLTISNHVTGGAVDFITLPEGKTIADIQTVLPHEGRNAKPLFRTPEYFWCLYRK